LLLQKDPKLRPTAAEIPNLLISELQMPNYVVKNYDNGNKNEGQHKGSKRHGLSTLYRKDGSKIYEGELKDRKYHG
jgi:hypothetical protein